MNNQLFTSEHLNVYRQEELRKAANASRTERVHVGTTRGAVTAATLADLGRRFASALRLASGEARATVGH